VVRIRSEGDVHGGICRTFEEEDEATGVACVDYRSPDYEQSSSRGRVNMTGQRRAAASAAAAATCGGRQDDRVDDNNN